MHALQIGDEKEIMYFRAKSDKERKEWMEAFIIGIILKNSAHNSN